jgi:uncharacterized BrkB/YihY/UPF0761 family membrane protein
MKRMSPKATDRLTIVHKLVGVVWIVAAIGTVVLALPLTSSGVAAAAVPARWQAVKLWETGGDIAGTLTLLIGIVYGVWTVHGFFGRGLVLAKWVVFAAILAIGGFFVEPALQAHAAPTVVWSMVAELVGLGISIGLGVVIERMRHAAP